VGVHGRAKAGPYKNIRPAEAGAGRYRCPGLLGLDFSPSERTDPLQRVRCVFAQHCQVDLTHALAMGGV